MYAGRRKNSGSFEGDVTVTTIDSAAASGVIKKTLLAAFIAVLSTGLAGCETGSSLFGSSSSDSGASIAQTAPPAAVAAPARIAVAPVFGPSETVAKSLHAQMLAAIEKQNITVAKTANDKAEYTLRGYIISSKEKSKTKFSYVWDVTDPTGKRLNRIAGEEIAPSAQGRDPWAAVTPQIGEKIASKTATNLAAWLPTVPSAGATPPSSGAVPPARGDVPVASLSSPGSAPPPAGGPGAAGATTTAGIPPAAPLAAPPGSQTAAAPAAIAAPPATGSIDRGPLAAIVPTVQGAPGGGSLELTNAIQRELTKNGVSMAQGGGQAYRVEGRVIVGQAAGGKQPIEIEWQVKDPTGKKLGTVSQKNNIDAGSLDGPWGKVADMVAEAAVRRIVELLPNQVKQAKAG
jgi:hypothetical protein